MRIGGLFAGYSGLEMGVQAVLGGDIAWHSEIDPGACKILAHRYPGVPNLGDIKRIGLSHSDDEWAAIEAAAAARDDYQMPMPDWSAVEPVDVLTAGYPCQPFSAAGKRQGTNDPRHLWPYVAYALGNLRPEWCLLENVRGHLTLGFDQVIRDLSLLHYEARWVLLRASDIGAPHGRARIFILGRNRGRQLRSRPDRRGGLHRNPGSWWNDAAPVEGSYDGQGAPQSAGAAPDVRRSDSSGQAGGRADEGVSRLAAEWPEGGRRDRAAVPDAADEGGAGADRAGVPADDRRSAEARESHGDLGRGDAPSCTDSPCAYPGGELAGAGCSGACTACGDADGGVEVRGVVGAAGGSVRSGGVCWSLSDLRTDDRWSDLPPGCVDQLDVIAGTVAHAAHDGREWAGSARHGRPGSTDDGDAAADAQGKRRGEGRPEPARVVGGSNDLVSGASATSDPCGDGCDGDAEQYGISTPRSPVRYWGHSDGRDVEAPRLDWGTYTDAIRRWERVTRPAPAPTEPGKTGQPRLSPAFVEWMMGLPAGWVTDVPGLTRNEQLKALGNGVVPAQAAEALRLLLPDVEQAAA